MRCADRADRVVVYDAPASPATTKAMIEKFREQVPDKPISHVVLKFVRATETRDLGDAKRPRRVLEVRDNPHVNRLLVLHDVANRAAMASDMYSDTTPFNQVFDHFAASDSRETSS